MVPWRILCEIFQVVVPRSHSTQLNFQGGASLSKLYNVGSHYGSFEFGTKVRNANKTQNQADQNYVFGGGNPILFSGGLSGQTNSNYYDGSYKFGPGGDAATNKDPIIGLKGPNGDNYLYAHTQYDVQGSYRLMKGLRVVASGLNLSNEVFGFYVGSSIYPIQREYYKPSVMFRFRWDGSGSE